MTRSARVLLWPHVHPPTPPEDATMPESTNPYDAGTPEHEAYDIGAEHGQSAATWHDGPFEPEYAARLLGLIRDGDPCAYDYIPSPDLSGGWAGDMTGPDLVAEVMPDATDDARMDALGDVCTAYELGYSQAAEDHIVAACTRTLLDSQS